MIKKPLVRVWDIIRKHRKAFLIGTILPSIAGLFLAETVMAVQFKALQPILGGMTFLTVEALGAWLVDFPLSVLAGCMMARKIGTSEIRYGALAGAAFLTVFILLVGIVGGGLRQLTTFFDVFGLGDAVLVAVQTARQQLGFHLGVIMFMFLVSDYFLCMLGGILGFHIIRFGYPSNAKES
ncbi:MAG: hypothetical protein IPM53_14790 [Anaerolineaceae bacterium]|nr:hypothetical protein [Anaerolineaceae bacterium]